MRRTGRLLLLLWLAMAGLPAPAGSQEAENRAGLVIQHGDGTVRTACVPFSEPTITGLELLRRAGIAFSADSSGGLGTLVCALDGEGCDYPAQNCFCQCRGAACRYWQYWHLVEGGWQYAQLGVVARRIGNGGVDGWVWAVGEPGTGVEPPATSFAELCLPTPAATPSITPTAGGEVGLVAPTGTPAAPTVAPLATETPPPISSPGDGQTRAGYLAFAAIVVALLALMARQVRRR